MGVEGGIEERGGGEVGWGDMGDGMDGRWEEMEEEVGWRRGEGEGVYGVERELEGVWIGVLEGVVKERGFREDGV